jgi:hypothetical protein
MTQLIRYIEVLGFGRTKNHLSINFGGTESTKIMKKHQKNMHSTRSTTYRSTYKREVYDETDLEEIIVVLDDNSSSEDNESQIVTRSKTRKLRQFPEQTTFFAPDPHYKEQRPSKRSNRVTKNNTAMTGTGISVPKTLLEDDKPALTPTFFGECSNVSGIFTLEPGVAQNALLAISHTLTTSHTSHTQTCQYACLFGPLFFKRPY